MKLYNKEYKTTPGIIIFNKTSIVISKTYCEHLDKKWDDFKQTFVREFADSNAEIIVAKCGFITWPNKKKILK